MWVIITLLSAVLYAALWLLARASRGIPSSVVTAVQAGLGPVALAYGLIMHPMPWHEPVWQAYFAFDCAVMPFALLMMTHAAQRIDVSVVSPLSGLSGLMALLFAVLLFGDRFTALGVAGVLVTAAGLALLYHGRWHVWATPYPWMVLCGIVMLSIGALLASMALRIYPHPVTMSGLFLTSILVANGLVARRKWRTVRWTRATCLLLLTFAVASMGQEILTMLAFQMAPVPYVLSVKRTSIIIASIAGYFLLHERDQPLPQLFASTVLVVTGVVMIGVSH